MAVSINGNGTVTGLTDLDTSDLTVDTNTLHVDSTNNRVGIGTTTPTTTLDVSGTVNATTIQQGGSAVATESYVDTEIAGISVTPTQVSDQANTSTGYFDLPVGTTAQRPASPASGMVRHNTTTGEPEWYDSVNSQWVQFRNNPNEYSATVLMVAGGGGGGCVNYHGGGGGAGGTFTETTNIVNGTSYSIVIGAGGAGATGSNSPTSVNKGGNTTMTGMTTAIGGGGGGGHSGRNGAAGGSGGGCGYSSSPGAGTTGQGYAGGLGTSALNNPAGGGGGATQVGVSPGASQPGHGGDGLEFPTGSGTYYGGGGGGSAYNNVNAVGDGGLGGGGQGSNGTGGKTPVAGTANTGGGGGGGERNVSSGASGGSGIVIIRYAGAQRGTGGTVVTSGGYTTHTFTSSGTFTG